MVEPTTSAVAEISRAAELFQSAKKQQFQAIGKLFEIYLRAKADAEIEKEVRAAFDALVSKEKPTKCKTLTGIISWLAFPLSKQRVSDAHKILGKAPDEIKTADDLANWIETKGGIRATLLSLTNRRNGSTGSQSQTLDEKCHNALGDLGKHANVNTRTLPKNPIDHQLVDGQKHIQVTEYLNGKYKVFDVLLLDNKLEFPKKQTEKLKSQPASSMDDIARKATGVSVKQSSAAIVSR